MSSNLPGFGEAFRFWVKLGLISFGGPAGQMAIMQTELVDRRKWISQARFLHALNYCMLLPGPEAQQLAIYLGWLFHKTRGGIVAGPTRNLSLNSRLKNIRNPLRTSLPFA